MGSSNDWSSLVNMHFPEYCNILVDLPGHGKSQILEQSDYAVLLDDLVDQLSTTGISQFVPIGYSMGGRIALHLQQAYPDHVPALVGLSTAPGIKDNNERLSRLASDTSLMNELEESGFESFLNEWYALPLFCSTHKNKTLMDSLIASRSKNNFEQLRTSLELLGNGAMPSLWGDLTDMTLPVLLMSGTEDKKYENINQEMAKLMPLAEHHSIQGADHAFHLEKPLDTAHLIRHFLRQVIEGV